MINFEKYKEFVKEVTSDASNHREEMIQRLVDIEKTYGLNPSLLMTAAIGLSSESGEFIEIVKKAVFQGKPLDNDVQFHLKRELGDIMWYVANACRALDLTLDDIISENVDKLKSRYPGGEFDVHYSENRKEGDL
jgi:NTP pyrophosphatase (non-canonical NTP hydrolase)